MGRNRTFDEDDVVAQSAAIFLRQGYEGTSIDDLLAATGLHRGSLYKAFASKRGLFLATLRRTSADATTGRDDAAIDLLLVALLELAPRDPEVRALCASALAHLTHAEAVALVGQRLLTRAHLSDQ